jgi:hypothetical protein
MNEAKTIQARLFISLITPLLVVTLGGLIVYGSVSAFFFPAVNPAMGESNAPAAVYYGLTLVVALMFFLMRQGYKWTEFIAIAVMSVVFSISMQKMSQVLIVPIYIYIIPILVFFLLMWLVLKFVFLNKHMRQLRLLIFSIFGSGAFTLAFKLLYMLLHQPTNGAFVQSRFMSGLMLFICMGFGLSLAELMILKLEDRTRLKVNPQDTIKDKDDKEADDETK